MEKDLGRFEAVLVEIGNPHGVKSFDGSVRVRASGLQNIEEHEWLAGRVSVTLRTGCADMTLWPTAAECQWLANVLLEAAQDSREAAAMGAWA